MRFVKLSLIAIASTVVILGAAAWLSKNSDPEWPHFPEVAEGADAKPQILLEYDEPFDFGYRTGNLIPIKVLVKVPANASIEPDTLAVNGDMQLVGKRTFSQRAEDGTKYYRFDCELRNFVYKPKLQAKAGLAYRMNSDNQVRLLETESIEIYPSKTFDGRKMGHPKDPVLKPSQGYHGHITISMMVLGLGGMAFSAVTLFRRKRALRRAKEPQAAKPVEDNPWTKAKAAFDAVIAGDISEDRLRELVRCLRTAYNVAQTSYGNLQENFGEHAWNQPLGVVLQICEDACIWRKAPLTAVDLELLASHRKLLAGVN